MDGDKTIQNAFPGYEPGDQTCILRTTDNYMDENEELTILVEIVAATIQKRQGHDALNPKGMHCTATWIGPINPSGRKRRETFCHRTNTLKLCGDSDSSLDKIPTDINTVGKYNQLVFTVEDSSLFLFNTTMKQLVNASTHEDKMSNGGLRFDLYEKPMNILTTSVSNAVSDIIRQEKEACAMTSENAVSSLLGGGYRLIGSVFLSPQDILSCIDGSRHEFGLVDKLALTLQDGQKPSYKAWKVFGASLVLRMRKASRFDIAFIKMLRRKVKFGSGGDELALLKDFTEGEEEGNDDDILPVQLLTEIDEKLIAAQTSFDCIGNVANVTHESIRYLISDDTEIKHHVRPYPDPSRRKETTMLTKSQLREECYKPSTKWVHAGTGSIGNVFIEFLECRGLPNTDIGGAVGNQTDAFISAIYGDAMVQTDVIDDCLSPMWMPWITRAFKFQMSHPSTAIFIALADYDVGPLEHETIGRVEIQLNKFTPGILYTLTYNLHNSSNFIEFGERVGKITVRIRVEYDEHKMLMASLKGPDQSFVTSKRKKTHKVAKYCTEGPHDENTFELQLFWSLLDEIWSKKQLLGYIFSDAFYSLIFWRDQVAGIPLHSAVVFYATVNVIERPHLLPSYFLFLSGWVMFVSLLQRNSHPNPWKRGHSLFHYWNILIHGKSLDDVRKEIRPMEGYMDSVKYERRWTERMNEDNRQHARQVDLHARLQEVAEDTNIRTKSKAKLKGALIDQMLAPKLLPYQVWLSKICHRMRFVRNVLNWSEAEIAFFVTITLFGSSFIALFIPWTFLLRWTSRIVVWVGMGPWMKMADLILHGTYSDESRRKHVKAKTSQQITESFQQQYKVARIERENALKMKAFRKLLFGKYNARVPERGYLSRHEDIPLPESFTENLLDESKYAKSSSSVFYIPGQKVSGGDLIPRIGHEDQDQYLTNVQDEKNSLLSQFDYFRDSRKSGRSIPYLNRDSDSSQFELVRSDNEVLCLCSSDLDDVSIERSLVSTCTSRSEESKSKNEISLQRVTAQYGTETKMPSVCSKMNVSADASNEYSYSGREAHVVEGDEGVEVIHVMGLQEDDYQSAESLANKSNVYHYVN